MSRGDLFLGLRFPGKGRRVAPVDVLGGDTISGVTTANQILHVGPAFGMTVPVRARYATLMVDGPAGGGLYFGRNHAVGTHFLTCVSGSSSEILGDSYTFDYVDVRNIALQDNGTATDFTIDFTGP